MSALTIPDGPDGPVCGCTHMLESGTKENKKYGVEYQQSMFPHGIKGITSYYELVMHR